MKEKCLLLLVNQNNDLIFNSDHCQSWHAFNIFILSVCALGLKFVLYHQLLGPFIHEYIIQLDKLKCLFYFNVTLILNATMSSLVHIQSPLIIRFCSRMNSSVITILLTQCLVVTVQYTFN